MNEDRALNLSQSFDYCELEKFIRNIQNEYEFIEIGTIGKSILGRSIPRITLGKGNKSIVYIVAHHGMEWITTPLLCKFVEDFCNEFEHGVHFFDISSRVLFETRKIHIIPMLNPDGVDYAINGVNNSNPLYSRLLRINPSFDFTHWQANARGVDLNHNYSSGFNEYKIIEKNLMLTQGAATKYSGEYPESEPETRALCNFVRFEQPHLALTLHTQGEEIYYTSGENSNSSALPIAKTLSRLTGYKISFPTGTAKYGGFTDWFIDEFNKPSFTLECGLGTNPLPFSDFEYIYCKIKKALFTAPILV